MNEGAAFLRLFQKKAFLPQAPQRRVWGKTYSNYLTTLQKVRTVIRVLLIAASEETKQISKSRFFGSFLSVG